MSPARIATPSLLLSLLIAAPCMAVGGEAEARFAELHGERAPIAPACLGPPLAPDLLGLGDEVGDRARADWRRRLRNNQGRVALAPLGPLDPSLPLLVVFTGNGMNFQDLHGVARLQGQVQVVAALGDVLKPLLRSAGQAADALEDLAAHRRRLASFLGREPAPGMAVLGHSFGAALGQLAIWELAARGRLGAPSGVERPDLGPLLFVGDEGPWRGADLPVFLTVPVVKQVAGVAASMLGRFLNKDRLSLGNLSLVNGTRSMKTMARVDLRDVAETELVTVRDPASSSPGRRDRDPLANWYTEELGEGELERLWRYFRGQPPELDELERWRFPAIKEKGLRQLVTTLARDRDYPAVHPELVRAALEADGAAEFGTRWDLLVARIVDTFQGHHTNHMWEDPDFLPWLRSRLADFQAGSGTAD